jgi:hypothetical protein
LQRGHAGWLRYESENEGVRFHEVAELSEVVILQVQDQLRRRVLDAFLRWGLLEADAREEMLQRRLCDSV